MCPTFKSHSYWIAVKKSNGLYKFKYNLSRNKSFCSFPLNKKSPKPSNFSGTVLETEQNFTRKTFAEYQKIIWWADEPWCLASCLFLIRLHSLPQIYIRNLLLEQALETHRMATPCQLFYCVSHHKLQKCSRTRHLFSAARIRGSCSVDSIRSMLCKEKNKQSPQRWTISKTELALSFQKCWSSVKYPSPICAGWYSCVPRCLFPHKLHSERCIFFSFSSTDVSDFILVQAQDRKRLHWFRQFCPFEMQTAERKTEFRLFHGCSVLTWGVSTSDFWAEQRGSVSSCQPSRQEAV